MAFILSIISLPVSVNIKNGALVVKAKSFWWHPARGVRAFTLGNVIVLSPKLLPRDLEHEYIHVEQHMREPFIHPILSFLEIWRYGFKNSKYEREAYKKAGNKFIGH
jgi:hypothetical protein